MYWRRLWLGGAFSLQSPPMMRPTVSLATIAAGYSLNIGELEQLQEFIRRNEDLLPAKQPGLYDLQALAAAARLVTQRARVTG
jgi:hypothetical protein